MLCCYLNVFVFVYIIDLKEYSLHFYGLYQWMHRYQHSFKKIPSKLWVVWVGYISFQEICYAGKPQVESSIFFQVYGLNANFKLVLVQLVGKVSWKAEGKKHIFVALFKLRKPFIILSIFLTWFGMNRLN